LADEESKVDAIITEGYDAANRYAFPSSKQHINPKNVSSGIFGSKPLIPLEKCMLAFNWCIKT